MKKSFVVILLFLMPITSFASGPYDGIYLISVNVGNGLENVYISIHEDTSNNQMIGVTIDPNINNGWMALSGMRTGNNVAVKSIAGINQVDTTTEANVSFDDNGGAVISVTSCINGVFFRCRFPTGAVIGMTKVF